jgi:RNA polymerase sigma-70 factor (ECF subfamily)
MARQAKSPDFSLLSEFSAGTEGASTENASDESPDEAFWYAKAAAEFGRSLARMAVAHEFDRAQQQDLLQEIHLALWRSFAGFRNQCSLRTWVYRVAHNTASTYVRRQKRFRLSRLISLEELEDLPGESDTERALDESALIGKLRATVQRLKPLDRDVMLLYLEGTDAATIGEVTGLSPANVAQKIHRTKKVLQRYF